MRPNTSKVRGGRSAKRGGTGKLSLTAFPSTEGLDIVVRYDCEQVSDTYVDARLKQQCRNLAAMMRLVIEEVLNQ